MTIDLWKHSKRKAKFKLYGIKSNVPSNLQHKARQIPQLECFSSRLAVVFAQSTEARC